MAQRVLCGEYEDKQHRRRPLPPEQDAKQEEDEEHRQRHVHWHDDELDNVRGDRTRLPGRPDEAMGIEAAAYRGRPVYWHLIRRWDRPDRMVPYTRSPGERVGNVVGVGAFSAPGKDRR